MLVKDGLDAPGRGAEWFAVSTDVREPRFLSRRNNIPAHLHLDLTNPDLSVIGCWSEYEFHLYTGPAGHVLAFGFCPRAELFAELAQNSCSDSAIDRLMRRLPGSFHLIAARPDGTLRVQGSASGLRRDLSGGLDSTPLCFLINSLNVDFVTFSHANLDPAGDDLQWVRLAQPHLSCARSLTLMADELPHCYYRIGHSSTMVDEPDPGVRNHARLVETAGRLIAEQSVLHFGGAGGDELFFSPPNALHTIFQSSRRLAFQRARAFKARRPSVSWAQLMRALTDARPYDQWLREQLARIP